MDMSHHRAFTFVEMLVVVAIIAILGVLLFPMFQRVMDRVTVMKFCTRLQTVAKALQGYAADHDATFPAFVDERVGNSLPAHWQGQIAPYLGEDIYSERYSSVAGIKASPLHDPADKTVNEDDGGKPQRNVAINGTTLLDANGIPLGGTQIMGVTARRISTIARPGHLMMVGQGVDANISNIWGACARFGFGSDYFEHCQRYPEGMYFAFADGHVDLRKYNWVKYEFDHRYDSAFFDWNGSALNPEPLANPENKE